MQAYWLGPQSHVSGLSALVAKWSIQPIQSQEAFRSILSKGDPKIRHFLMEVTEINEKKYLEVKALNERFGKSLKFIVFYQKFEPSPQINKLHGSDILLIGPEDRNATELLLGRFLQSPSPLFRRWSRFQMVTPGILSPLSDQKQAKKVTVLDFSAHGACLRLAGQAFSRKDFVVLEYLSQDGKKIRMQSRVAWLKPSQQVSELGVQFISREV